MNNIMTNQIKEKLKCPRCKKYYRKLHKVNNKGLKYYCCYKCYLKRNIRDEKALEHYHDEKLFTRMVNHYLELEGEDV